MTSAIISQMQTRDTFLHAGPFHYKCQQSPEFRTQFNTPIFPFQIIIQYLLILHSQTLAFITSICCFLFLFIKGKMLEREAGFESPKIWTEPKHQATELRVPVIYYLSRNGQLEHPHLMEVPISSPRGVLCVKDVIDRLSFLRGQGMTNMYSWSTKRSYKNGFVWQDLSENDFIYPSSGHEYVLKGTQMIEASCETISTSSSKSSTEANNSSMDADSPATINRRSQSLNSCDYKFYKAKTCEEFAGKATNASTQTEEKRRERIKREKVEECEGNDDARELGENEGSSSRFSSSSFGALEGSLEGYGSADIRRQRVENERPSGRIKASEVLMQFIRCG